MIHISNKSIHRIILLIAGIIIGLFLVGCNKKNEESIPEFKTENAIMISQDFSITATLVESFAETYYRRDELLTMITDEVTAFNAKAGAGSMRTEKVETAQNLVNVVLKFSGWEAYAEYNEFKFFVGTIEDALNNGFELNEYYYNIEDAAKTINGTELSSLRNTYILITNAHELIAPMTVETFGGILYVSEGIEKWVSSNSVRIAGNTGDLIYIIFKR
jgi:hypothetical protein